VLAPVVVVVVPETPTPADTPKCENTLVVYVVSLIRVSSNTGAL
jgi:hypothetical protein